MILCLQSDTIRKRAWPKLVGLDHNYDPLPLDDIVLDKENASSSSDNNNATASNSTGMPSPHSQPQTPTIEIDAQHELFKEEDSNTKSKNSRGDRLNPSSTLIVESMDTNQIDRDVARCTWHLLTGSQRSRRSQHRSITKNSTRGTGYARQKVSNKNNKPNKNKANRIPRNPHRNHTSSKYRRNRKVAVLLKKKQNRLANLINLTLVQSYDRSDAKQNVTPSNRLRYYQGYHDVACIFLHALGGAGTNPQNKEKISNGIYRHYSSGDLELPSKVLCQVSFSHFSDALRSDFLRLQTGLKLVLFPLLSKIDRDVHDHLMDADMEPFFCLSWILTWFAHDVRDTSLVKRLFDAFLVGHPALPIYASLAMMTHPYNRQRILETDCDFAALHQCLASLPKHSCKVGYKEQKVDGFDNVVVYVSDDDDEGEGETPVGGDANTIQTNTDSYVEEEQSEFDDDNDSHTFDTRSNYTCEDSVYTESSFPTSLAGNSGSQFSEVYPTGAKPASIITPGGSISSGCPDPTALSMEEPDFSSKESTLVSGKWNEPWEDSKQAEASSEAYVLGDRNPVPFESVLDAALQLMKKYPPKSLVGLAKGYFRDDWESQLSLLSMDMEEQQIDVQDLIGLLHPTPPAWAILPSCTSDWVDKQKQRQDLGMKPTSRKDRRRRKKKNTVSESRHVDTKVDVLTIDCGAPDYDNDEGDDDETKPLIVDPMDYVRSNPEDRVVVAIGYGPGLEAKMRERKLLRQQRRRRKRRRALAIGCGVIVIGAIVMYGMKIGADRKNGKEFENISSSSSSSETPTPHLRQLRSQEDKILKEGNESARVAAVASPKTDLPVSTNAKPETKTSAKGMNTPTLLAKKPTDSIAPDRSSLASLSVEASFPVKRKTNNMSLVNDKSSIIDGMVRKTKLFLTRFVHHLWIVCRGFVSQFRLLTNQPPQSQSK